jgi:hypothetical protein
MRRSLKPTRLTPGVLALALLAALVFAGSALAAEPTITKPAPGTEFESRVGVGITPVEVTGTSLASLKVNVATPLPKGLNLEPVEAETHWVISGTPEVAKPRTTVTLEATSEAKTASVSVEWTVHEALPTIGSVEDRVGTVGDEITPIVIKGTNLGKVTASPALPTGLELSAATPGSETEWTIHGIPAVAEPPTTITLHAKNNELEAGLTPASFKLTVHERSPTIEPPADQTSTAGKPITTLVIKGTNLATLITQEPLPAGLVLKASATHPETEWEITGTPTTPKAATSVTLEAKNKEKAPSTKTFKWTVVEEPAPKTIETPAKPPETPAPPPPTTIPSAGRLGTLPVQKPGKSLTASFLCEVASCQVQVTATITAGKKKFKIHSARTPVAQGQKAKLALKLSKAQQALVAAALKKHKKVTAALAASITSSVGFQVTKALVIAVKR